MRQAGVSAGKRAADRSAFHWLFGAACMTTRLCPCHHPPTRERHLWTPSQTSDSGQVWNTLQPPSCVLIVISDSGKPKSIGYLLLYS
ncbi:hypothetical protein VTK26DRAFT_4502 [Humicola hyalothermophila]